MAVTALLDHAFGLASATSSGMCWTSSERRAIETRQRSMNRSSGTQAPSDDPTRIWRSKTEDEAHTFGIELFGIVIAEILDLRVEYTLQLAEAQTQDKGGVTSAANAADFPEWAGDPRNIRFLSNTPRGGAHLRSPQGHRGSFQNSTSGRLIDREAMLP